MIVSIIISVLMLGVLIFVHELGHFIMAKRAGLKVQEFGFGFPPRLFGIQKGETTYSINWIPLGGFVSILGEDGSENTNPRSFAAARPGVRAGILIAGVVMNIILGAFLLSVVNGIGSRVSLEENPDAYRAKDAQVSIVEVVSNSPADEAGLQLVDAIVGITARGARTTIIESEQVIEITNENRGLPLIFHVQRGDALMDIELTPRVNPPEGEGAVGIRPLKTGVIKYGFFEAVSRGVQESVAMLGYIVEGFYMIIANVIQHGTTGADLAGPVGIVKLTSQAARIGVGQLLFFAALLSLNLAILNILPIPPLDGGKLLFVIIEKIRGVPVSKKIETVAASAGFLALIMLVIYVTIKDIAIL